LNWAVVIDSVNADHVLEFDYTAVFLLEFRGLGLCRVLKGPYLDAFESITIVTAVVGKIVEMDQLKLLLKSSILGTVVRFVEFVKLDML